MSSVTVDGTSPLLFCDNTNSAADKGVIYTYIYIYVLTVCGQDSLLLPQDTTHYPLDMEKMTPISITDVGQTVESGISTFCIKQIEIDSVCIRIDC